VTCAWCKALSNQPEDSGSPEVELYESGRDQFIGLVGALADSDADTLVPITPGWTIREVTAHLCGLNADIASGMRTNLGTDERTAYQVEVRRSDSVAAICDEWVSYGDVVRDVFEPEPMFARRLASDLAVHLHDVQHALGLPVDSTDALSVNGGLTYAELTPPRLLDGFGICLRIELDGQASFGPEDCELVVRASPYDFLRSVTGRRSRTQVLNLDWEGSPEQVLDHLCPYGPLRSSDAEI